MLTDPVRKLLLAATPRLAAISLAALALLAAATASATPTDGGSAPSTTPAIANASSPEADASVIVLIGDAAESPELSAVLTELLSRQKISTRFVREARFQPGQLLAGGESDRAPRAFIVLPNRRSARLYFRGPRAQRFLLRELSLRDGLDEVGRELIGQVVESSIVSLLRSSAGISREQVRAVLDREADAPGKSPTGEHPGEATVEKTDASGSVMPDSRPSRIAGWLALRYAMGWSGADLGAAHGPGAEIGLEWRGTWLFRTRLSAERWFAQTIVTPELEATAQNQALRVALDFGWPMGHTQTLVLGMGAGADVTTVEPGAPRDPTVTPSPARTHAVPIARAELRYELAFSTWRVVAAAFADTSLLDTHYDLDSTNATQRVAAPWPVRPGAALVLAWRPSFGAP